jgi:Flp pilus assembly protein TadB
MNPLSRLLAGILAVLALAAAFFFGLLVLAVAVGVGFVAWLLLWVRSWRNRRNQTGSDQTTGEIIDAEYTVVSRQDED